VNRQGQQPLRAGIIASEQPGAVLQPATPPRHQVTAGAAGRGHHDSRAAGQYWGGLPKRGRRQVTHDGTTKDPVMTSDQARRW